MQSRLFQAGGHKMINGILGPGRIGNVRNRRPNGRIEWPLAVMKTRLRGKKWRNCDRQTGQQARPAAQEIDETQIFITPRLRFG